MEQPIDLWCPPSYVLPSHLGKPFSVLAPARQHTFVHTCAKLRSGHLLLDRSLPAYARRYGPIERAIRGHRRSGAGLLAIANERTAATQARRRHHPPGLPAGCQASAIGARATLSALSVPKAIGLGLRLRLPDDGQRHLRCCAKGGDAAIGQSVGIVLAAVLDLKVQPRAPAFAGHLAAVGFAGQVHPGAGAVLDPEAVDAERRVYVQAEALGAAAFGQADLELRQAERRLHALGPTGGGFVA